MKKTFIFLAVLVLVFTFAFDFSYAATCSELNTCSNGNPELVVGPTGFTNSQLPQIKPGESRVLLNGKTGSCPFWFPMNCVDITGTQYFIARWGSL